MVQSVLTRVNIRRSPQPDAATCQATCLTNVANLPPDQIQKIRQELLQAGDPGNPSVMALVARRYLGKRYSLDLDSNLKDCETWLTEGEVLITHGWFTRSGHVIKLDGFRADPKTIGLMFDVEDPWDEFMANIWRYSGRKRQYSGFYSARLIYAACVASTSVTNAAAIYRRGELDSRRGGMWVHRIKPA